MWGALLLASGRFGAGGALLLVSVVAFRWPHSVWRVTPSADLTARQRWLALAAVCAVAIFFRTYQLEPPGIWGDDAINGLRAFDVLDGKITSPFQLVVHAFSVFHALTNYTIAGAFWLLGPGPVALRVPGLVGGVLAVPLLYGAIAPLFGARVGLVAALFFATSPLQLNHDKVLLQVVLGEFFLLCGMCALVQGIVGGRRWLIALSGAPLALCLYTYHSAKIAPLVALLFLLPTLGNRSTRSRTLLAGVAGLCAVFLLCALPGVIGYLQHPDALTRRADMVALWPAIRRTGSLRPLWKAVWHTLMIFHYRQGPIYHWVGIGWDPAFTVVPAFLLVHGAVESLRRWREPRHLLLLGWLLVGLLPGFLSTGAPRVYRVLLASPPLYVWAALPVVQLCESAAHTAPRWRWIRGVAVLVALSVPLIDFNYYFYRVYTNREFRWFQATRLVEMARMLKVLGAGWTGYVLSDSFAAGYETLAFLSRAWGVTFDDVRSLMDILPIRDEPQGGVLFIVDRSQPALTALIRSLYPTVEADVRFDPPIRSWWFDRWWPLVAAEEPGQPTVTFFAVPRRTIDSIRGVSVMFLAAHGEPIATRIDPQWRIDGAADMPPGPATPAEVKWSGALYAPVDGTYQFELEAAAEARVWMDERLVLSQVAHAATLALAQGLHRIAAEAIVTGTPAFHLRWQPPDGAMGEIPAELLFRRSDIHGLLATYDLGERTVHRIEPYPYYDFFQKTFPEPFASHWRGRLHVPMPGRQLDVSSNGTTSITIDGQPMPAGSTLSAGDHDLAIDITDVQGAFRLQVLWEQPRGGRQPIPPTALTPPFG
jgi:hypothetical protein